ncbi:rifin [Plasmodium reichenowi]|uniref:Rifin n=1 Tax=Plasmodium reichenowi TaxID=5854 RepID=A0A060RRH0_PLARE|nr:rifin [Plasmodium reichenowi]
MKVHYINILLFALPLNILVTLYNVYNQRNHKSTTLHTNTNRSLCECDLYMPNYDNDPQMKEVMDNFNKQTQQRFEEYDERIQEKRMQCKDKCDKEVKKIILKDKLEKQMAQQFATLHTDIQSDAIPTCVCEKSLADKMEKGCLRCGGVLGGGVAPSVGLFGSVVIGAWKNTAIAAATKAAIAKGAAEGLAAGNAHGMKIVTTFLEKFYVRKLLPETFEEISRIEHFSKVINFADILHTEKLKACNSLSANIGNGSMCESFDIHFGFSYENGNPKAVPGENPITKVLSRLVERATQGADAVAESTTEEVTAAAIETNTGVVQTASYNWYTTISYSILAILIIVLIMLIIYLILRYRRKKKMRKKLQYIKLLEE